MDLSTNYLGLKLRNPLVPSASPFSQEIDNVKKLEEAGAAAIVMYSIFEEQLLHETQELDFFLSQQGTETFPEALSYFPKTGDYRSGPEEYIEHIRKLKAAVSIPIISSINCVSKTGWVDFSQKIQQAGADALELNLYYIPTNAALGSDDIEKRYLEALQEVKKAVTIPVAVKLSPYFTNMAAMMSKLDQAGADGLVLFNRFYQPDINLDELTIEPGVVLSSSSDLRLSLRWIAIMYGKIKASLAGSTGVHTAQDAIKLLMAGADVVNLCSVLLKNGPQYLHEILKGMDKWLDEKEYSSIPQLKGSLSQKSIAEPAAFERANYMKALSNYTIPTT